MIVSGWTKLGRNWWGCWLRTSCGMPFFSSLPTNRYAQSCVSFFVFHSSALTEASLVTVWCDCVQDLPNAMNAAELTDKLGLHSLRHRNWYIQATCATSGDGLYEGLDWLANQLKNTKWRVGSIEWGRAWVPAPGIGYSGSIVFTWRGNA